MVIKILMTRSVINGKLDLMVIAVIPCYDVAPFCERVVRETIPFVSQLIVIDDGSKDGTGNILKKLSEEFSDRIECISFPHNRGKGHALLAGMQAALPLGAIIVFLDGDGQHHPRLIAPLANAVREGADLAIGSRDFSKMPWKSRIGNRWITFLLRTAHMHAPKDTQSGMRAMSLPFVKMIIDQIRGGRYETEFLCLLLALDWKRKIVEVPIPTIYIEQNRFSHFSPFRDAIRILKCFLIYKVKKWKKFFS